MLLKDLNETFIIAEIGINHNGDLARILEMIDVAAAAGANAVKLQVMTGPDLVISSLVYQYQDSSGKKEKPLADIFSESRVRYEWLPEIYKYAEKAGIVCLATPFSFENVDQLETVNNPIYKISSGDITHQPLINYIAATGKPIIISTGKSTLKDISRAVGGAQARGNNNIALLHCVSNYPTPIESLNLNVIDTLMKEFDLPIGFSDHSEGYFSSAIAVAKGARIIEKHFTLDKKMPGPDHWFSLDPDELKLLVDSIRDVEKMLGDGIKKIGENEEAVYYRASRSIVAKTHIPKGTIITDDLLDYKRPGSGLKPYESDLVIGKKAVIDINPDEIITLDRTI